jgi:hypothetical protein
MSESFIVLGRAVDLSTEHFYPGYVEAFDVEELRRLRALPRLSTVSFCDFPLDDVGLRYLCEIETLDNLALQGVQISNEGLAQLARLPRLRVLRLKDNRQLTDACCPHLAALRELVNLQLHETSITRVGLAQLVVLTKLEDLIVAIDEDNFDLEFLRELSVKMPGCRILAKGKGQFLAGKFSR